LAGIPEYLLLAENNNRMVARRPRDSQDVVERYRKVGHGDLPDRWMSVFRGSPSASAPATSILSRFYRPCREGA